MDKNPLASMAPSLDMPARSAFAITPSDTTDLTTYARSLYIGVTGDVTVDMVDEGTQITFKACPVGILPIAVRRVRATGTAATNIIGLQ